MDTANTTEAFADRIRAMTAQLRDQLAHDASDGSTEGSPAIGEMLDDLYKQGAELGLTNKEIVQQLISPVAEFLRPGLAR
jgi:hypothetical protein